MVFPWSSFVRRLFALAFLLSAGAAAGEEAPRPAPAKPHFDILEYQVEGNTTLDQVSIEKAVYPFLGEARTADDVESARAALETVYRQKGFATVSVYIPPQKVTGGVITLKVGEGRVGHLHVLGAQYFSQEHIIASVQDLQEGRVPYFPKVQEQLAQVNSSPDMKVTPLLRPGQEPGTTDVDLEVQDHVPFHGSVEVNNYYSPMTSGMRLIASADYDNLFQAQHRVSAMWETSPIDDDQVRVWSASYTVPIDGQFLALSIVDSDSATVAGLAGASIFGKGKIVGLHDIIPLPTQASNGSVETQSFSVGLDYKDFAQNVNVAGSGSIASPAKYIPFTAGYTGVRSTGEAQWEWGTSLEFAARNLDSSATDFDNKRYQALNNFVILKADVARTQPLPGGFSAYGRLDLQLSDQPLISNEEMVVGGAQSVRGYLDASATGDSGVRGTVELRSPNLVGPEGWVTELRAHWFTDGAYVKILDPLPEQTVSFTLLSTGIGLRAKAGPTWSFDLDLGIPLRTVPYTRAWRSRLQANSIFAF